MHDKVLGFIRETLLHENLFDSLAVDLLAGEVRLNLLQPNPHFLQYPDPELLLTFSGVREFLLRNLGPGDSYGEDLLGFECSAEGDLYRAEISIGHSGASRASWAIRLTFTDLRYKRSRSDALRATTAAHAMDTDHQRIKVCDECGSDYFASASSMSQLCPECSHWLYGYPRCPHEFTEGRCSKCGWDGSVSDYVRGLRAQRSEP